MNRVLMHCCVILATGVIIGLIVRSRRVAHSQPNQSLSAQSAALDAEATLPVTPIEIPSDTEGWLHSFELTERTGETVKSEDLKGQPYVASFFFTTCPSTCPMQNEKLRILQEDFKAGGVRLLSISCDPEVDTPEVLAEYAERYNADEQQWLFLTGELNYIRRVGAEVFQLPVNRRFHTDRFVLVDGSGKLLEFYEWKEPSQFDKLKKDIQSLLDQGDRS